MPRAVSQIFLFRLGRVAKSGFVLDEDYDILVNTRGPTADDFPDSVSAIFFHFEMSAGRNSGYPR